MSYDEAQGRGSEASPAQRDLGRVIGLLVDSPRQVRLAEADDRSETVFRLRVAQEDLGKVIGRQGRTARALRTLLDVRGSQDGRRYGLEIRES